MHLLGRKEYKGPFVSQNIRARLFHKKLHDKGKCFLRKSFSRKTIAFPLLDNISQYEKDIIFKIFCHNL